MVAHTHHSGTSSAWSAYSYGRRNSRGPFRLHPFLMQKVYKNILVLVVGFCALQLIFGGKVFVSIALAVLFISALSQKAAVIIDKSWLWFGEKAGKINAAILLFLIYYLMLTPIAFLARIGKKDPLQLNAPKKSNFVFKQHSYTAKDLQNPW